MDDSLSAYRAKRSADTSPEPIGTVSVVPGRLFVVHKHAATRLHFDLRLEMNGVLRMGEDAGQPPQVTEPSGQALARA